LYGGKNGVVSEVKGQSSAGTVKSLLGGLCMTGGSATYDVIWDDGSENTMVPECIIRGVQWRILDGFVDADGIAAARAFAKQESKRRSEAETARAAAFSAEVQRLRIDPAYAHLSQDKVDRSSSKLAAANIRADLKKHLPDVKFSVRSHSHSSIEIRFHEGATTRDAVKAIVGKYTTGYYDSLSDCHLASSSPFNTVYGGVEHVWAQEGR
jgi:hypothetical protein